MRQLRPPARIAAPTLFAVLLALGPPAAPSAAPTKVETYDYLVFSDPVAGREEEYNRWYDEQHAPDVVAVPGFVTAQRLIAAAAQLRDTSPPTKYLVVYRIVTDNLAAVNAEVLRRLQTGQTVMSSAFRGSATAPNGIFRTIGPLVEHKDQGAGRNEIAGAADAPTYYQLVFVNPVPGRELEFEDWYDRQHLPDMVSMPGFVNGQRLKLASGEADGRPSPYQYLIMYKIVTRDLPSVFSTFHQRATTMTTSPSFGDSAGYTYQTLGPPIAGDKVRAARQPGRGVGAGDQSR